MSNGRMQRKRNEGTEKSEKKILKREEKKR